MIEERKDKKALIAATECCRDLLSIEDIDKILAKSDNIMFISGNDVGLAIFDYPGVYTVHWYYMDARGRAAINLGKAMTSVLFETHNAKILRALIKRNLKASRWACRQLGFKSCGFLMFPNDDENEFLYRTFDMYQNMKGSK